MGTWTRTWLPPAHVSDIHGTKQQRIQCPAQWSLNQSRCLEIPRFKSPQPSTAPERCTHSRTPPRQATLYLHTKATWRSHLFFPQRLRNVFLKAAQLSSLTFEPTQADTCIPSTASPGPAVEGPGVRAAGLNRSRSSSAHAKHSDTDKMLVLITLPVRAAHDLVRYTCHAAELTVNHCNHIGADWAHWSLVLRNIGLSAISKPCAVYKYPVSRVSNVSQRCGESFVKWIRLIPSTLLSPDQQRSTPFLWCTHELRLDAQLLSGNPFGEVSLEAFRRVSSRFLIMPSILSGFI